MLSSDVPKLWAIFTLDDGLYLIPLDPQALSDAFIPRQQQLPHHHLPSSIIPPTILSSRFDVLLFADPLAHADNIIQK